MSVKIFFCYAHEDEQLRKQLEKQLRTLKRQGLIEVWHDRNISAGTQWQREIDQHLNTAQIILLLVSPDFMDSDYSYAVEMKRAIERHERGEARVIPIIIRPVDWQSAPFSKYQALPKNDKPVTKWRNRDEAFQDVVGGIRKVVEELSSDIRKKNITTLDASTPKITTKTNITLSEPKYTREQWLKIAVAQSKAHQWTQALAAYEHVTQIDPDDDISFHKMADILVKLERYNEALVIYERVIKLNHKNAGAYMKIGDILMKFRQYEEALIAYEQAIKHAIDTPPDSYPRADAFKRKGDVLYILERYEEAFAAYDEAIDIDPNPGAFYDKGIQLLKLKRYEEALAAYDMVGYGPPGFDVERAEILYALVHVQKTTCASRRKDETMMV